MHPLARVGAGMLQRIATTQHSWLPALSCASIRFIHSNVRVMGQPERGCSIDEIKEAAKRAGDASKDWMSGSSEHAPRAMEVTVTITEELYVDTKRALDETLGVGKQRNEKALDHVQHTGDGTRLQDEDLSQEAKASIAAAAQSSNDSTMAEDTAADKNASGV